MTRRLEPVDLMVVVGLFATILGGYFLFMATSGTLDAGTPAMTTEMSTGRAPDIMDGMDWLQPAMGQAIVTDYLQSREIAAETASSMKAVEQAGRVSQELLNEPYGYLAPIIADAERAGSDQAARAQYAMGRSVVNFTKRGVRTSVLSPENYASGFNSRMIRHTEAIGQGMDEEFQARHQPALGRAIVTASLGRIEYVGRVQEELGGAIARLVTAQVRARETTEAQQGQMAALIVASARTIYLADRLDRLAAAEASLRRETVYTSASRSWPEIPAGVLFGASAALIGIFFGGLLLPALRPEAVAERREARTEEAEPYRKTG